jgi:putative acetyltransferase
MTTTDDPLAESSPRSTFVVRHAEPADFEALHRVYSGPKAIGGTLRLPYASDESYRRRLAEQQEGSFNLLACAEGEVVGHLGLHTSPNHHRRRHVGQIGMAVRDDWQGCGAGTALMGAAVELADRWLNLLRLELEVFTDNQPAIRLYQKFGFEIEGTLRKMAFRDGAYVDAYAMGRLRADWR